MRSHYRNNTETSKPNKHVDISELTSREKRKARDSILKGGYEKLIKQLLSKVPLSSLSKRTETRRLGPVKDLRIRPEPAVRTGTADLEEDVEDDTEEIDVEEPTHINKIRASNFVLHRGDVHLILTSQHVSQARSRGHYKVKMRNLINNKEISHSFADGTKLSVVTPNKVSCIYKGVDERSGEHQFQSENLEIRVAKSSSLEKLKYLKPELKVTLSRWRGQIIGLLVPHQIQYKVTDVNPGNYAATLENGMVVLVPSYIKPGDSIDINTAKGEFLRRSIIG
ncbi:elongation factor P [Babesia ovata]|uniref:Elongation factor P n=1 Tax=Babesia ovata TaxID=189622 RepID=A0A2H6KC55_9APIC|nr:elongation factor P [Babesia ovata]GBE60539.1 elongation factor P [Babesia ovata]